MDKWAELNDFSAYEGSIPCVLCKADSSKTILGNHWKCSICAHLFNQDGSELKIVQCHCEACQEKNKEPMEDLEAALKQLKEFEKQQSKPKKKSKKKTK